MQAVEDLRARVRSVNSRRYVEEVIAAYTAGATRSAIIALWVAVTADLMEKIRLLADDDVPAAKKLVAQLDRARQTRAVAELQKFERELLDVAKDQLHLLGDREFVELGRLRDDRNLCAHPAFTGDDDQLFAPTAELVRAHLTAAVDGLLSQGAVSGRKAIERLVREVTQPSFPAGDQQLIEYLRATYWDRGNEALRRSIVQVAAKHSLSAELYVDHRWRYTRVLLALAEIGPGVVEEQIASLLHQRQDGLDDDGLWRLAGGLCHLSTTWGQLHSGVQRRLEQLVSSGPIEALFENQLLDPLPSDPLARLTAARVSEAVEFTAGIRAFVSMNHPDARLYGPLVQTVREASSYTIGATALQWINALAPELPASDLEQVLDAASDNDQVYTSILGRQQVEQLSLAIPAVIELPAWQRWLDRTDPDRSTTS